jgi:hypothetical protein|tara:strand:- start:353 stop:550 length:198 start_codon:yes stop_codon:yes gene_type:complete
MTHWKKLFTNHLIKTGHSVNIHLKNQNVKHLIRIPKKFKNEQEMKEFSNELNNSIKFPHLKYLQK